MKGLINPVARARRSPRALVGVGDVYMQQLFHLHYKWRFAVASGSLEQAKCANALTLWHVISIPD